MFMRGRRQFAGSLRAKAVAAVLALSMLPAMTPVNAQVFAAESDAGSSLPFTVKDTAYGVYHEDVTAKELKITDPNTVILTDGDHPACGRWDKYGLYDYGFLALQQKLSGSQYRYYIVGKSGKVVKTFDSSKTQDWDSSDNHGALRMSLLVGPDQDAGYPQGWDVCTPDQYAHTDSIYYVHINGSEHPDLFNASTEEYISGSKLKEGYVIDGSGHVARGDREGHGIILPMVPKNSPDADTLYMLLDVHGKPLYDRLYESIELVGETEDGVSVYKATDPGNQMDAVLTSAGTGDGQGKYESIGAKFRLNSGTDEHSYRVPGVCDGFVSVVSDGKYGVYSLSKCKVLGPGTGHYANEMPIYMGKGKFLLSDIDNPDGKIYLVSDNDVKEYDAGSFDNVYLDTASGGYFTIQRTNSMDDRSEVTTYRADTLAAVSTVTNEDKVSRVYFGCLYVQMDENKQCSLYGPKGNLIEQFNRFPNTGFCGPLMFFEKVEGSNTYDYYNMTTGELVFQNVENGGRNEGIMCDSDYPIITLQQDGNVVIADYQYGRKIVIENAEEGDEEIAAAVLNKNGLICLTGNGTVASRIEGGLAGEKRFGDRNQVILTSDFRSIVWKSDTKVECYDSARQLTGTVESSKALEKIDFLQSGRFLTVKNNRYGLTGIDGKKILDNKYDLLGTVNQGVMIAMEKRPESDDEAAPCGVLTDEGEWLIHGTFRTAGRWEGSAPVRNSSRIGADPAAVFLNESGNTAYLYDLTKIVEPEQAGDEVELESTSPANGAENVKQAESDITLTFSGDVDFLFDRKSADAGKITIKDSDGKTVLSYDMVTGSRYGEVCYKSSTNKRTLILRNALTVLKTGETYSVSMDNRCVRPAGSKVWYQGFSGNQLHFTMGGESAPENDLTYLAACILEQKNGVRGKGMTVSESIDEAKGLREFIWKDKQNRYTGFLGKELGGYTIEDYQESNTDVGYLVLKNPDTNRRIVVVIVSPAIGADIRENYIADGYATLAALTDDYPKGSFVYTGVGSGGLFAAFAGAIDNVETVTFNAPISVGIDAAFAANDEAITEFNGVDKLPIRNYSDSLFSAFKNKGVRNFALWHNLNGRAGDLNALFNYRNGNYVFQETMSEDKANKSRTHISMEPKDLKEILKTFTADEGYVEVNALKAGWQFIAATGTEVYMGLSQAQKIAPISPLRSQIFYGGSTSGGMDDCYGGTESNVFVFTGGSARFIGGPETDTYYLNGTGGVKIMDLGNPKSLYKIGKSFNKFLKDYQKGISVDLDGLKTLKKYKSLPKSMKKYVTGDGSDTIVLNDSEIKPSMFWKDKEGFHLRIPKGTDELRVYLPQIHSTGYMIRGQNDTEFMVWIDNGNLQKIVDEYGHDESGRSGAAAPMAEGDEPTIDLSGFNAVDADYDLRSILIEGGTGSFDLKKAGEILESGSLEDSEGGHYVITEQADGSLLLMTDLEADAIDFANGGMTITAASMAAPEEKAYVFQPGDAVSLDLVGERVLSGGSEVAPTEADIPKEEAEVTGISVIPPKKLIYRTGESFDSDGMKVYPVYSDGSVHDALVSIGYGGFLSTKPGEISVSVDATIDGKSFSTLLPVTIVDAAEALQSISVDGDVEIGVGKSAPLAITCDPENTDPLGLIMESSDESIARIAGTYVYGEGPGTAEITIRDPYGFASAKCQVTVTGEAIDRDVQDVEELIQSIGVNVDSSSKEALQKAIEAYNKLTEEQKAQVSNYANLIDAAVAYEKKTGERLDGIDTGGGDEPDDPDNPYDPGDDDDSDNYKENINDYHPYLPKKKYIYTGKAIKPAVECTYLYKPTWSIKYQNNVKIGQGTVILTGKGDYYGTSKLRFTINPAKAKLTSVKPAKKKMTVKFGAVKGGVKYQLAYRMNKGKWKVKTVTKRKVVIKKLKSKKKYTVRVRAFKKVGKKTYYGAWSAVKKVKIK